MNIADDIAAISLFVKEHSFEAPFFTNSQAVAAAYKRFLAVLLQRHGAHKTAVSADAIAYLDETASDLSYALYLNALGFYKPSRLSLRGAIENSLRYALTIANVDPKPLSVSRMFDEAKTGERYKTFSIIISSLRDYYAELCRSSHTIDIQFMSQNIPFEELIEMDKSKFDRNLSIFAKTCSSICSLIFIAHQESVTKLSPEHQDFVRSEIPVSVKKAILNS